MGEIIRRIYQDDALRESLNLEKQMYYVPDEELHEMDKDYEEAETPADKPDSKPVIPEDEVRIIIE